MAYDKRFGNLLPLMS